MEPEQPVFKLFGPVHLTVIAITIGLPILLAGIVSWTRSEAVMRGIRYGLAAVLFINWAAFVTWSLTSENLRVAQMLPMQLCDWAMVTVILALLTRNQTLYELSYFWGLAGTFQAVLTPNLQVTFPDLRFISFFVAHSGIVAGVLFMTMAMALRPWPFSLLRAQLWSEVYLVCALTVNHITGENYGFLSHRPAAASLLDYLSSNRVLYILEMNLLAVLFFLALYIPFALHDLIRKARKAAS